MELDTIVEDSISRPTLFKSGRIISPTKPSPEERVNLQEEAMSFVELLEDQFRDVDRYCDIMCSIMFLRQIRASIFGYSDELDAYRNSFVRMPNQIVQTSFKLFQKVPRLLKVISAPNFDDLTYGIIFSNALEKEADDIIECSDSIIIDSPTRFHHIRIEDEIDYELANQIFRRVKAANDQIDFKLIDIGTESVEKYARSLYTQLCKSVLLIDAARIVAQFVDYVNPELNTFRTNVLYGAKCQTLDEALCYVDYMHVMQYYSYEVADKTFKPNVECIGSEQFSSVLERSMEELALYLSVDRKAKNIRFEKVFSPVMYPQTGSKVKDLAELVSMDVIKQLAIATARNLPGYVASADESRDDGKEEYDVEETDVPPSKDKKRAKPEPPPRPLASAASLSLRRKSKQ